ncbi:CD59 glycoprotein-like [Hyperolius riggenbachi]|uniref:CD59 glycoprotein-like n=1 Tax=Hyperolius riggenbachi TaxID=752182 RepID=UPI0035A35202
MKVAVTLLILVVIFLQGEALKCRKTNCPNYRPNSCSSTMMTCPADADNCFVWTSVIGYQVSFSRGCMKRANCQLMSSTQQNFRCCSADLCN